MSVYPPVKFRPIAVGRIWGGHKLKAQFGEKRDEAIGEYWVLSAHPSGTSVVLNGQFIGKSLTELCDLYPQAYLGKSPQQSFPLLVKFLEAEKDLSVQIHPNDQYARQRGEGFGKTEAWYVLDVVEGGKVNYGHRFTSRDHYLRSVEQGNVPNHLLYRDISPGEVVYVPARTLHALLAGTTVIEVQQTSDITYRVYDWDRVDAKGNKRQLHIEEAADVLDFDSEMDTVGVRSEPTLIERTNHIVHERLIDCEYFTMERLTMRAGKHTLSRGNLHNPDILIVADGAGLLRWDGGNQILLSSGDTLLIPATLYAYDLVSENGLTVIRAYY